MAKNQNTFAKRQREMEKKAKAEAKRARKAQQAESGEEKPSFVFAEQPDHDLLDKEVNDSNSD